MTNNELVLRVLTASALAQNYEDLWWRTDGEYAPVSFFVNCNDLFYLGTADAERITEDNIEVFEQACKDAEYEPGLLFCCRVRKMRPQGAYYECLSEADKLLFDACGPEREQDFWNLRLQDDERDR